MSAAIRHRRGLGAAAALLLLLGGCEGCRWLSGDEGPHTPYFQALTASPEGATRVAPLKATRLATAVDEAGVPTVLVRTEDGALQLGRWAGRGWTFRTLAEGVYDDAIGLARLGEELVSVHVGPPEPEAEEPAMAEAHPDAARGRRKGEGDVVVLRVHGDAPPRRMVAARRALAPSLAVGSGDRVHLAFVQPTGREEWTVVHLEVTPDGVERTELGPAVGPLAPVLTFEEGRPLVAWVAPGPKVSIARLGAEGTFEVHGLPQAILGEPRVVPSALDLLPGDPLFVAWVRPLPGGEVEQVDAPVDYPEGVGPGANLLMVTRFDAEGTETRALAAAPLEVGPAAVQVTRSGASARIAAVVHGVPVAAEGEPDGWRVWVPVPGHGRAVAAAGPQALYATETGLWASAFWSGEEAATKAEGVAPGMVPAAGGTALPPLGATGQAVTPTPAKTDPE